MQTHAGTTGRTFSNPRGGVRERRKTGTFWEDLCFYFHDLSHKLSLTLTVTPLGKQPFQHKGTVEEAKQGNSTLKSNNAIPLAMLYQTI